MKKHMKQAWRVMTNQWIYKRFSFQGQEDMHKVRIRLGKDRSVH